LPMAGLAALQVRPDEPLFQLFLCTLKALIYERRKTYAVNRCGV
jgi:hypothetical protein